MEAKRRAVMCSQDPIAGNKTQTRTQVSCPVRMHSFLIEHILILFLKVNFPRLNLLESLVVPQCKTGNKIMRF